MTVHPKRVKNLIDIKARLAGVFVAFTLSIGSVSVGATDGKVAVIGVVFRGSGKYGDFACMIEQSSYQDALFVFNDNEGQYKEHRDRPGQRNSDGCAPGGGNAVIRPYQCRRPPRAVGIPTGPNYERLTPSTAQIIEQAVEHISQVVKAEKYRQVFYSATNDRGDLGTSTFTVGDDVKRYIVEQLKSRLQTETD
jgi:hypothetical protein